MGVLRLGAVMAGMATLIVAGGCAVLEPGLDEQAPSERAVVASHILYSPDGDPGTAPELPPSDPAWAAAEAEARHADRRLRATADPTARVAAFRELAAAESEDLTGPDGGSLGTFLRDTMVPEFADPIFEAPSPEPGDIIGPVRTDFGWHVILYEGEGDLSDVEER